VGYVILETLDIQSISVELYTVFHFLTLTCYVILAEPPFLINKCEAVEIM